MTPFSAVATFLILAAAGLVVLADVVRRGEKEWNQRERVSPESPTNGEAPKPPSG